MALVPVLPVPLDAVLELAGARWAEIADLRPDLRPAVDLQRRLLKISLDLTGEIERGGIPRLSLPSKYLAAKLTRGVPVFAGEPIPLPVPTLTKALLQSCAALAEGGAGDVAGNIGGALASGAIEPGSLLSASFARNQEVIRIGATHRGLAPDLMWLVAELAVGPFAHLLQRRLFDAADAPLTAALDAWDSGHCPACGSWPALAEVAGGRRCLRCSFCASAWQLTAYCCVYCGEAQDKFITAAPDGERKDRRIEACNACGGYLKTIDVPALSPFPLLSIADLETTDLDVAAMDAGYRRLGLKEKKPA